MKKTEMLSNSAKLHNGYLSVSEAQKLGISRAYIQEFIKNNEYEKVAHGLYKKRDAWTDELYILSLKNEKAICSFDTALMLHGLTEREPSGIFVTVPGSYNATHLRNKGISVYQVKEEWFNIGKASAKTAFGNEVPVYDAERTICDLIRVKSKKDPQMFAYAIKEYAKSKNKNLQRLIKYAEIFGVEKEIRFYMEVLL